ncbi:MAG: hypothetical protein JF606_17590 [Burkholderiales bacterium]|nr:hypothetical protein [Burkholderiales bacterium]
MGSARLREDKRLAFPGTPRGEQVQDLYSAAGGGLSWLEAYYRASRVGAREAGITYANWVQWVEAILAHSAASGADATSIAEVACAVWGDMAVALSPIIGQHGIARRKVW